MLLSFLVLPNVFGPPTTVAAVVNFKNRGTVQTVVDLGTQKEEENSKLCQLASSHKSIKFEMPKTVTDNNIMRIANAVIAHF